MGLYRPGKDNVLADNASRFRSGFPGVDQRAESLQYLCEFIKKCGQKGVLYSSSVSDGFNLALFDPATAAVGNVTQYRIDRVSVDMSAAE